MEKLLLEFIECGWIERADSEWASRNFITPNKEKGEWRLAFDHRGLNEQTEHDSYSLQLINCILQKQQKKRTLAVLDLKHGYHQMLLLYFAMHSDVYSTGSSAMEGSFQGNQKWGYRLSTQDGGSPTTCTGLRRPICA